MINFKFELVKFEKFITKRGLFPPHRENYEFKVEVNHQGNKSFAAYVKYSYGNYAGVQFVPNQREETLPYPGNLDTHMLSEALRIYCNGLRSVPSYIWIGEVGEYVGESV